MSICSIEENVDEPADDDSDSKFYSTVDAVVSQLERFHVDSQKAKPTTDFSAVREANCNDKIDNTSVDSLTASISAMRVAGTASTTETETRKIVAVGRNKSNEKKLHKLRYTYYQRKSTGRKHSRNGYRSRPARGNSRRYFNKAQGFYNYRTSEQNLDHLQIMWLNGLYRYFKFVNAANDVTTLESNFGYLNCDCLLNIFSFLRIVDRFNADSVCKQWHLASQESWRGLKRLDVDIAKWIYKNEHEYKRIKTTMFKAILEKSGRYLTVIDFTYSCTKADDSEIFILNRYESAFNTYINKNSNQGMAFHGIKALALNCTRIEKLSLCSLIINCNDQHLYRLFRKNKKIRYLNLIGYAIDGKCFSGLSAENITTLLIQRCHCILSENLYMLLPKCTSLSGLSLWRTRTEDRRPDRDVLKLVSSNIIKNLKELYLLDMNSRLLCYCSLRNFRIDVTLDNLTVIQINDVEKEYIDQILIDIGANCKNLTMADLSGCCNVTDDILINITSLPKLEVLFIDQMFGITDRSLVNLSEHLKALRCVECNITDAGVVAVLNRSQNIELIDLSFCRNITRQIVDYARDLTKGRTNNIVLNMMYAKYTHTTDTIEWEIEEMSPYFRLHSAPKSVTQPFNVNTYSSPLTCNVPYRVNSFDQKLFFQIDSQLQKICDHV